MSSLLQDIKSYTAESYNSIWTYFVKYMNKRILILFQ